MLLKQLCLKYGLKRPHFALSSANSFSGFCPHRAFLPKNANFQRFQQFGTSTKLKQAEKSDFDEDFDSLLKKMEKGGDSKPKILMQKDDVIYISSP